MKCPHCSTEFHDNWVDGIFSRKNGYLMEFYKSNCVSRWEYRSNVCPACMNVVIEVGIFNQMTGNSHKWRQVYPVGSSRGPVPKEVPPSIAHDYAEACNVFPISAKASAALSRRCLQSMFHSNGYKSGNLAKEIDLFLNETDPSKIAPSTVRDTVDMIRHFGNFSAHPITELTTLQIIDIEPHEAETCLDIIETLFEHFYVAPAEIARKKAELDAKLKAAGKPPSK